MRWTMTISVAATVAAIGWVAVADDALSRACRASIQALLHSSANLRPGREASAEMGGEAEEAAEEQTAEEPPPSPDQAFASLDVYVGHSQEAVREKLGAPAFSDMRADYFTLENKSIVRIGFVDGLAVSAVDLGMDSKDDRRLGAGVDRGTRWDELKARWGLPEYAEPGAWFYAGDDRLRGVIVFFEQGIVVGTQALPTYWRVPPPDETR